MMNKNKYIKQRKSCKKKIMFPKNIRNSTQKVEDATIERAARTELKVAAQYLAAFECIRATQNIC